MIWYWYNSQIHSYSGKFYWWWWWIRGSGPAPDGLIRTSRDHGNEVKDETAIQLRLDQESNPGTQWLEAQCAPTPLLLFTKHKKVVNYWIAFKIKDWEVPSDSVRSLHGQRIIFDTEYQPHHLIITSANDDRSYKLHQYNKAHMQDWYIATMEI